MLPIDENNYAIIAEKMMLYPRLEEEMERFFLEKEIWMNNQEEAMKTGNMKRWYDLVYNDLKWNSITGYISENTFWEIVDLLQEGL